MSFQDDSEFMIFQAGDSGSHLASLAARLSEDFKTNFQDVLGQLEDLRLAEWSDQAPPPPALPLPPIPRQSPPHTYANYPQHKNNQRPRKSYSDSSEPIYCPGQYAVRKIFFFHVKQRCKQEILLVLFKQIKEFDENQWKIVML